MKRLLVAWSFVIPAAVVGQQPRDLGIAADSIFAQWNSRESPGCAVAVARRGETLLSRGYGMADLETGTPITPQTIFESGSVAKQFTATATLLLAADGRINLDDPVRKYIPELPDYSRPLLVRHLLSHTSGLREWSNLVALTGWPRGQRAHTQADLLAAVVAQRSLNYPVGDYYSYTNSGFALLETIVERVSGMPFARFEEERIFRPLGMTHSSWRDDFTRIVPGRAQAYARRGSSWHLDMPFEDVVGPGGMLTTVGDWLIWNQALDRKTLGANVVDSLEKRATLTSGRTIEYGMGLFVRHYRGLLEIAHSGSTGGYSTYLARYPERGLSIAVMCNAAGANATGFTRQLLALLEPGLPAAPRPDTVATDTVVTDRLAGVYRSLRTHQPMYVGVVPPGGRGGRGGRGGTGSGAPRVPALRALRDGGYLLGNTRIRFQSDAAGKPRGLRVLQADGDTVAYAFASATPWTPGARDLQAMAGRYRSDEVGATWAAVISDGRLSLSVRPGVQHVLTPVYPDAFSAGGLGTVWFTRDARGAVTAMHVGAARIWDIVFTRVR